MSESHQGDLSFWRSLAERAQGQESELGEFLRGQDMPPDEVSRRAFLQLLGASMALAGVSGCAIQEPGAVIIPYNEQPPAVTPGVARYYATSMSIEGYATGLLVQCRAGRPLKVEGNPLHPASLGKSGVFEQASLLDLYDPYRARNVLRGQASSDWRAFVDTVREQTKAAAFGSGRQLHFLLEPTSSPTLVSFIEAIRARYPDAGFTFFSPLSPHNRWQGARLAFGEVLEPVYDLTPAKVVLAVDSNFLASGPNTLRYANQFAAGRRLVSGQRQMNRLYVAESDFTVTGATADHRLARKGSTLASLLAGVVADLLATLPVANIPAGIVQLLDRYGPRSDDGPWVRAVAADLIANRGASVIIVGDAQPPVVHALGHAANFLLGAIDATVRMVPSPIFEAGGESHSLAPLIDALRAREREILVVLGGDPVYTMPVDVPFGESLSHLRELVYLGPTVNATSPRSSWFLPEAHYMEAWGDGLAYDGTYTLQQPLVRPLWGGHSALEVLAVYLNKQLDARAALQETHTQRFGGNAGAFEQALRAGLVEGSATAPAQVTLAWPDLAKELEAQAALFAPPADDVLELSLAADSRMYDGRYAGNVWLLELPDPLTKVTWDNVACLSPKTAQHFGVDDGDLVEVAYAGRKLTLPALVQPGHADAVVSIKLGYGQSARRGPGKGIGANAYGLRQSSALFCGRGAGITKLGGKYTLALTQTHWSLHGRPIVLAGDLEELQQGQVEAAELRRPLQLFHHRRPQGSVQWGMAIDLTACIGCSACVVACQAENNIPTVGKVGVRKSREMHWLRIDRYYSGDVQSPRVVMQPMLCQQCESAPCEYVCPVHATVHSADGLNEMIYNRCVGTRFCSNNCPYKVRRFNWLDYNSNKPATLQMAMNPDVTVRARGVMEKCTFCVQRIRRAGIDERVPEIEYSGNLQTACQQACPTNAIVFGAISDPKSAVAKLRDSERAYAVLHDVGTVPRIRYLMRVRNPNPKITKP